MKPRSKLETWFMTLYGFSHSGRVINALYGPAFAYLNGLLLLAVGTWYRYQIITSFLVFAVGGVGMYRAVHRFNVRGSIAVLVTIIYMTICWLPRWVFRLSTSCAASKSGSRPRPMPCSAC